jgi:hypothetical protein
LQECLESYQQAKDFAERYLGPADGITINLNAVYARAKAEIDSQMEKTAEKVKRKELLQVER